MGRFDALTQLEEKRDEKAIPPVTSLPAAKQSPAETVKKLADGGKKPANPQAGLPARLPSAHNGLEKPEKYTTRLLPSWVKKIRLEAIEKDTKDYEVVTSALKIYFESRK